MRRKFQPTKVIQRMGLHINCNQNYLQIVWETTLEELNTGSIELEQTRRKLEICIFQNLRKYTTIILSISIPETLKNMSDMVLGCVLLSSY